MRRPRLTLGISLLSACFLVLILVSHVAAADSNNAYITIEKPLIGTTFDIQSDVTISGTATPNSEISLFTDEGEYAKLTSNDKGTWSYTIPSASEGSFTIQAKVTKHIDKLSSKSAIANTTYYVTAPHAQSVKKLAQTGAIVGLAIPFGLFLIVATTLTYIDYRKHKRPLQKANPHIRYSFWHHLRVVSIPVIKYRLSINVDKRLPARSDKVRRY